MTVRENLEIVRGKIARAAEGCGRRSEDILLVAVVKNVAASLIKEAIESGITDLGENRLQEALQHRPLFPGATWHMIGHLQRNKVRQALDTFAIIQSVDSPQLIDEINRLAVSPIPVLIEVNTSGEASKYGVRPEGAIELVRYAAAAGKLKIEGLMTVGPLTSEMGKTRTAFRTLADLRNRISALQLPGAQMRYLSMGMSDDFEIAIEEGANILRIGRAIFGPRQRRD
jgi:pyridoxal phosphate enzyme (YggS family)